MKLIQLEELQKHSHENDCQVAVSGKIYDVTSFLNQHPGGKKILLKECGKDATKKFDMYHDRSVLDSVASTYEIGSLDFEKDRNKKITVKKNTKVDKVSINSWPFSEPNQLHDFNSLFYNESHRLWHQKVRKFVENEIMPYVSEQEEAGRLPSDIYLKAGQSGILAGVTGYKQPSEYIGLPPNELLLNNTSVYDAFHTHILIDEVSRCGSGGVIQGFFTGLLIGLPPIIKFGTKLMKEKIVTDCLLGKKIVCLCISEPWTASDVAAIRTTALKKNGYYLVNGAKKQITNGIFADYFCVAVRTSEKESGAKGLSLLLLDKTMPGIGLHQMKCQGVQSSGTTFITLDNVKVPEENLIGKEGHGFEIIMHNFNHERQSIIIMSNRLARVACTDAFRYALQRKTFGKRLIDHQVIRFKIADMIRKIEAVHAQTEQITYQQKSMSKGAERRTNQLLGDKIALLKAQSTRTLEFCAREALHIFGGSGYVRGGVGERVERIYRDAQAFSIPAGSEEIMLDFAGRSATKKAEKILSKI